MVAVKESGVSKEKKKRVSKKNKRSWRKHTDTKDVDSFLEDKRLEERLGAPFAERRNDELFQVDKGGDENELLAGHSGKKSVKPIRCFQILDIRSEVTDPIAKRNRVRTPEERKHPLVKRIEAYNKEHGILKKKEIVAQKNRALTETKRNSRPKRGEFSIDLWGETSDGNIRNPDNEWLNPTTLYHTLKNTGKLKKKMPEKFLAKPSETPVVEPPHPGMSYNPTYGDHQTLLQEVANKELALIKEEKHLQRVTSKMFSRITEDEKERVWMEEMTQGLPKTDEDKTKKDEEEGNDSETEYQAINPPAKNNKKTLKKRRKLKEARMKQLEVKEIRTEKKKISDIYRLKCLNQEIEAEKKKIAKLQEKREKVKLIKEKEPKQLSKIKFESPHLEFNLSQDLKGNLRGIKPEGNILGDRYKSLQKRNIIEPTIRRKSRKAKIKRFEKKSHKMGWEPKGY